MAVPLLLVAGAVTLLPPGGGFGPQLAAREEAERVAAFRMSLGGDPAAAIQVAASGIEVPTPLPLLEGAEVIARADHATRVRVEALGIDAEVRTVGVVFRDGALNYDVPRVEAGQYAGTGEPGRPGNVVIGGHVSTRGAPGVFRSLPSIALGEVIEVFQGEQVHRYEVRSIRTVSPDDVSVMAPTSDETLTLITCYADDDYSSRVIVVAKLI
jgi:LPXTG-site transpeptidase (sortase) family protein